MDNNGKKEKDKPKRTAKKKFNYLDIITAITLIANIVILGINCYHTNKYIKLQTIEKEIKIKENNDAWNNFHTYMKIAKEKFNSETERASAIHEIGKYYERETTNFPRQVHALLKNMLDDFWSENNINIYGNINKYPLDACSPPFPQLETATKSHLPSDIQAIYEVIKENSVTINRNGHTGQYLNMTCFNLTRAILNDCSLAGIDMQGVKLIQADLVKTNLSGAILDKANLTEADLTLANLSKATFVSAKLCGAKLLHADIANAHLGYTDLSNAYLLRANLTKTDLAYANLNNANLTNANLTNAYLYNANMSNADLTNVNLTGANIVDTDLSNAKLVGVKLDGAKYSIKDDYYTGTKFPIGFELKGQNMIRYVHSADSNEESK